MSMINQRIRRSLVLATVVAALAAPAAWAAPVDPVANGSYPSVDPSLVEGTRAPTSTPATTSGDGFDWGDAGLGAAAMLGLTAMAAGSALALRHRPRRGHTVA